jgi:hypothetical protein
MESDLTHLISLTTFVAKLSCIALRFTRGDKESTIALRSAQGDKKLNRVQDVQVCDATEV